MFTITESDRAFWLEGPDGQRMRLCGKGIDHSIRLIRLQAAVAHALGEAQVDTGTQLLTRAEAAEARAEAVSDALRALQKDHEEALKERNVAEKRVMELEETSFDANVLATLQSRITQLEAERNEAEKRVEALEGAGLGKELGERDVLVSTITQLEADLAAAKALPAHKLVADVVHKGREWRAAQRSSAMDEESACMELVDALDAAAGITVQPVRTLSKQGHDEAGGEGPAAAPLKAEDLPVVELPAPEPDEVGAVCRCGSGAHPRRCAKHPGAFERHCKALDDEAEVEHLLASVESDTDWQPQHAMMTLVSAIRILNTRK